MVESLDAATDPKQTHNSNPRSLASMHSGGNRIDSDKINDWLQIVGMFGIMASLIFVGVQVRQTQVIGEGESAIQFFEATIAGRQLFVDNIDVWIKGCAGEKMSIAEDAQFTHMYRGYMQGSYFAWMSARHNILELNPDDVVYPFAANVHRYPGLARIGLSWREWAAEGMKYGLESGHDFANAINARVAELQVIEPQPTYDVKFCGM